MWRGMVLLLAAFAAFGASDIRKEYPGVITLEVDAADTDHRVFRVREVIPVVGGRTRLHFPQWLPGWHSTQASRIWLLSGLKFSAAGRDVPWARDPRDTHTFVVDLPASARELNAEFQYLTPLSTGQGQVVFARDALTLAWNNVVLYPAGVSLDSIRVVPSLRLAPEWQAATSMDFNPDASGTLRFRAVTLATLIDSPVFAGRHVRKHVVTSQGAPVALNVVAESAEKAEPSHDRVPAFQELVSQAYKLFGAVPYEHFDFLVMLHERISHGSFLCLEHQSSTELPLQSNLFAKWPGPAAGDRSVIAHEFVHAWVGKKHRPIGMKVPNLNTAADHGMLWSYEGEASYLGDMLLATRSGLVSRDETLASIARLAAAVDSRAGRRWRGLGDSGNDPAMRLDRARDWLSWQRSVDHYSEGPLLWLEIDATIRGLTSDARSLDDFARTFHGAAASTPGVVYYTMDDVAKALGALAPNDWQGFLRTRLAPGDHKPGALALRAAGWQLVYKETQHDIHAAADRDAGVADFAYSLGMLVGRQDALTAVVWEGAAFNAGLAPGATVVAVNGAPYKADLLRAAITEAMTSASPIRLTVKRDDVTRDVSIDYHGGLRYPHLERITGAPDRLAAILQPRP